MNTKSPHNPQRWLLWAACLLAVGLLLSAFAAVPAQAQTDEESYYITFVATSEEFIGWLIEHPGWQGYAYGPDENGIWYVEFYDASGEEWLGYANVDSTTDTIVDFFIPRPLPADVYQEQQQVVLLVVLDDPEVLALLVDPVLWDYWSDYNRYEQVWEVVFYRGVDAIYVRVRVDGENYYIEAVVPDAHKLSDEEAEQHDRDTAIALAYQGEGVDQALEGYDDWTTYVEHQGGALWSVTFASGDTELFYALVDIEKEAVLETVVGGD